VSRIKINPKVSTRRIEIRLVDRNGNSTPTIYRAPNGSMYEASHVDDILDDYGGKLEAQFPDLEFRLVEKKGWKFAFVFERDKNFSELPNKAAQIMKEINLGNAIAEARRSTETPGVPMSQESPRIEDRRDRERT